MAVADPTTYFKWNVPNNLGDSGNWGALLRTLLAEDGTADGNAPAGGLDALLAEIRKATTIDTSGDTWLASPPNNDATRAMKASGGIFTGEIDIFTARYELVAAGATLSGAVALDVSAGNWFHGTVTGDITELSFSNVPAADGVGVLIELTDDGGGHSVSWHSSVRWPSGTPPTPTTGGTDLYIATTRDGGATWRAARSMTDSS